MRPELKKEAKVEIKLCDWFLENNCEVYTNRSTWLNEKLNIKRFNSKGKKGVSDLLVQSKKNNQWFLIEVKVGNDNMDLYKGFPQLLRYYSDYLNGSTRYIIDGENIKIDHLLIATEESFNGRLYYKDDIKIDYLKQEDINDFLRSKIKLNQFPQYEFSRTQTMLRMLWAFWSQHYKDKTVPLGVGFVLSSDIDCDSFSNNSKKPKYLSQHKAFKNNHWYQCWEEF